MKSIIAIALMLIPILHFCLIYFFSSRRNMLKELRKVYAILYLDWVFLPFNILFPFAVDVKFGMLLVGLFVGLALSGLVHHGFHLMGKEKANTLFRKGRKPTAEAIVHFIFMAIEICIITILFLSQPISQFYFWALLILLVYPLWSLYVTLFIYRKRRKTWREEDLNWGEVGANIFFALLILARLMMAR